MDDTTIRALQIAIGIVAVGGVLAWLLRYLGVSMRFLTWTIAAHFVFVIILGFTVAPSSTRRSVAPTQSISVVMLPPLEEKPQRESPPQVERMYVTQSVPHIDTQQELPQRREGTSAASRLLTDPSRLSSSDPLRRLAPNMRPTEFGARGVPHDPERGDIGGTSFTAQPTELAHLASGDGPPPEYATSFGKRTSNQTVVRSGVSKAQTPGAGSRESESLSLPEGFDLSGDIEGRSLKNVPDAPEAQGTDGGTVKLQFDVKPNGIVYNVIVKTKAGSPQLEKLAKEWASKLRFAPLRPDATQTTQSGKITVVFRKE